MARPGKKHRLSRLLALNGGKKTKKCATCCRRQGVRQFYVVNDSRRGPVLYYRCKKCHKPAVEKSASKKPENKLKKLVYLHHWRANQHRRLRKLVVEAKRAPCADCGKSYPHYVMDLDHVRGKKVDDVSKMVCQRVSETALIAEIAKCDIVCANCHRERSFGEKHRKFGGLL